MNRTDKRRLHIDYDVEYIEDFIIPALLSIPENPKKHKVSGYLAYVNRENGKMLSQMEAGECPVRKAEKYQKHCLEKAKYLFEHKYYVLSYQSPREVKETHEENEARNKKRSGAVAIPEMDLIVSFAGIEGSLDEAIVLVLCTHRGLLKYERAKEIAQISKNKYYLNYLAHGA